jgi:hypothetical protein
MTSTYDSVISHKALVLYAITTNDVFHEYNININISRSAEDNLNPKTYTINRYNMIEAQKEEFDENVWGSILIDGQGTGYALIQLQVIFSIILLPKSFL